MNSTVKRRLKQFATIFMALTLLLAVSAPALAAGADTSAYYYQEEEAVYATSTPITVYVTVESFKNTSGNALFKVRIPVTLDPGGQSKTFTVTDAFVALQEDPANDITFLTSNGEELTESGSYVQYVLSGGERYGPGSQYSFDGWMVRINDRLAILGDDPNYGGLYGAAINTTYLSDGDSIYLYMDDTTSENSCVYYTKLAASYTGGALRINVLESRNWFDPDPPYTWHIEDFSSYSINSAVFNIYEGGSDIPTETVTADGPNVDISVNLPAGRTYIVVMEPVFPGTGLQYTSTGAVAVIET